MSARCPHCAGRLEVIDDLPPTGHSDDCPLDPKNAKKPRAFTLAVKPSGAHANHEIVRVTLEGEVVMDALPLRPDELVAVTAQGFNSNIDNQGLSKLIIVLYSELAALKAEVKALKEGKLR